MSASIVSGPPIKKVAIVGPECTGKTSLAKALASRLGTEWVPEYARNFLDKLNRPYTEDDLIKIAHGQLRTEDEWMRDARQVLICDTNLMVIKVWSEFKFGRCSEEVLKLMAARHYDLLLLTDIDIPWENDPQREHPDKREELKRIYQREVQASGMPFLEISGSSDIRIKLAFEAIQKIL